MRILWILFSVILATALAPVSAGSATGHVALVQDEDEPEIVVHMRQVNRALRQLRSQVTDVSKTAENVKLVETMREHVEAAQELEPLKTPELPADEREDFVADFRAMLDSVLSAMKRLEKAIQEEDIETAKTFILRLNTMKDDGHERFRKK